MLILSVLKLLTDELLFWVLSGLLFSRLVTLQMILLSLTSCGLGLLLYLAGGSDSGLYRDPPAPALNPAENDGTHRSGSRLLFRLLRAVRYAGLILPLVPVLTPEARTSGFWTQLFLLIPAVYTVWLSRKPAIPELLADFGMRFTGFLAAGLAVTVLGQLFKNPAYCFVTLFLFATCGIFTLQLHRLYQSGGLTAKRTALSLASLGAAAAFIGLAASPVIWRAAGRLLRFLYMHLVLPVLTLFIYAFVGLVSLILRFLVWLANLIGWHNHLNLDDPPIAQAGEHTRQILEEQVIAGTSLWPAVIGTALILIVCLIFFRMMSSRRLRLHSSSVPTTEERLSYAARRPLPHGSAGSVRKSYRKLLQWLNRRGAKLSAYSTSEDVTASGQFYCPDADNEELRDIYRKVRYAEAEATPEEAKRAKEIVKKIMESQP